MGKYSEAPFDAPDGVAEDQARPAGGWHFNLLSLAVLASVMAIGLSGWAGGGPPEQRTVANNHVDMTLAAPARLRNGQIFEMRVRVAANKPLSQLVIAVEPALWRELATSSMVPQPAEQTMKQGLLRFRFDALRPGEVFEWQVTQQVNPSRVGRNRGRIVVLDGDRQLAELPVSWRVLP